MKKIIYTIITLLSIGLLITSIILNGNKYDFNEFNVKNNIEYLSSNKFKGRLCGSEENNNVANEIAEAFKEYKLLPLGDNYTEAFSLTAPVKNNYPCNLKLVKDNEVIKDFTYGVDFKEDMLNFRESNVSFSNTDTVCIYQTSFTITQNNKTFLFYVTIDKDYSFRSSFLSNSPYEFAIAINTNTYCSILDGLRKGYTLDVSLPYYNAEREVYNVAGKIKGYNSDLPPLVLTAHFDHVGTDSLGNIYYGALDNASGICFLLELARTYSSLRAPERDIIFVALNAEEFGLLGSKSFVANHKDILKDAQVINFDMIGADNYPITLMLGEDSKDTTTALQEDLEVICKNNNIDYNTELKNASDHASFIEEGLDALTLTHCNMQYIHTPKDTIDTISTNAIKSVFPVVNSKVLNYCYDSKLMLFYGPKSVIIFSITSFILVCGLIYIIKKEKDSEETIYIKKS